MEFFLSTTYRLTMAKKTSKQKAKKYIQPITKSMNNRSVVEK
jgi:hypothetical protein